jgi:hypothetical protein
MGEVIQFPAKVEVKKRRSRWRPITPEEYDCLVQFSQNPDLCRRSPFLLAMIERGHAPECGYPINKAQLSSRRRRTRE